jgi:type II restriction/modification system DNA methylase subunit YeeA
MWIIDFGWTMSEQEAALYEAPFAHIAKVAKPFRVGIQKRGYAGAWWRHERPRPEMWKILNHTGRYIATPTVAKHRLFVHLSTLVCPDHQLIVIARDDQTTFGLLHSRFHEVWSLRLGTSLEDRPRYTPTTTFETFPFPDGLTPDIPAEDYANDPRAARIADAAKRLDDLRCAWLSPSDLIRIEPEVMPGFPERVLPKNAEAEAQLRERTLTKLYNARPQWLDDAHADIDRVVATAYGWPEDIPADDALARLLELNLARSAEQ